MFNWGYIASNYFPFIQIYLNDDDDNNNNDNNNTDRHV
jgi:hypothetical protein